MIRGRHIRAAVVALVGAVWLTAAAPPPAWAGTPDEDLVAASRAYERGDYGATITLLHPLLYPTITLPSQKKAIQARRLLGLSYLFEKDEAAAEKQFLSILAQRPGYQLDSLSDPAAALEFFQRVKRKNAELLEAIRKRQEAERLRREQEDALREDAESEKNPHRGEYLHREVTRRNFWINLAPLGAGQFQNGHRTKGVVLGSLQAALGALSLGTYLGLRLSYPDGQVPGDQWGKAQGLKYTQILSGAACLGLVAYGVIDALVYYEPVTITERWIKWTPEAAARQREKDREQKLKQQLKKKDKPRSGAFLLGPSVGPGGAGVSLSFAF